MLRALGCALGRQTLVRTQNIRRAGCGRTAARFPCRQNAESHAYKAAKILLPGHRPHHALLVQRSVPCAKRISTQVSPGAPAPAAMTCMMGRKKRPTCRNNKQCQKQEQERCSTCAACNTPTPLKSHSRLTSDSHIPIYPAIRTSVVSRACQAYSLVPSSPWQFLRR